MNLASAGKCLIYNNNRHSTLVVNLALRRLLCIVVIDALRRAIFCGSVRVDGAASRVSIPDWGDAGSYHVELVLGLIVPPGFDKRM
jgi:hypothetical protein